MASRYEVEVKVGTAKDLKNVNWKNGDLRPYAVIWVESSTKASTKTAIVGDGDNPPYTFDESITLALPGPDRRSAVDDAVLSIDLVHAEAAEGVKPLIGSGRLSLSDVGVGGSASSKTIKLKRPSGRPQGKLEVKVTVRETPRYYDYSAPPYGVPYGQPAGTRDIGGSYPYGAPPPGGYPYGATAPPSGYPYGAPPPGGYPYGAPPAGGYPYGAPPPPQAGYPYSAPPPPQGTSYGTSTVVVEEKKGKFGAGTGLAVGAAAGLLGGLALAGGVDYIAEKAAEKVESSPGFYDDDDDYDSDY